MPTTAIKIKNALIDYDKTNSYLFSGYVLFAITMKKQIIMKHGDTKYSSVTVYDYKACNQEVNLIIALI